jgi:hypothetical protein
MRGVWFSDEAIDAAAVALGDVQIGPQSDMTALHDAAFLALAAAAPLMNHGDGKTARALETLIADMREMVPNSSEFLDAWDSTIERLERIAGLVAEGA